MVLLMGVFIVWYILILYCKYEKRFPPPRQKYRFIPGEVSDHVIVLIDVEEVGRVQPRLLLRSLPRRSHAHDVPLEPPELRVPLLLLVISVEDSPPPEIMFLWIK